MQLPAPRSNAELLHIIRQRTPARVLAGRSGGAYRTATQLALREDHAAARDAVQAELELARLGPVVERQGLFLLQTQAASKGEFLLRPELGRKLSEAGVGTIRERCPAGTDLQVMIGDGLSATAVETQVPRLLPAIVEAAAVAGWSVGQPFAVRYCRVGVLNDVGEILDPAVVVLLIGERPGLAAADSLSAYMAWRPRAGHTDARRNLISNIHGRGVSHADAVARILDLARQMRERQTSGVEIKERLELRLAGGSARVFQ